MTFMYPELCVVDVGVVVNGHEVDINDVLSAGAEPDVVITDTDVNGEELLPFRLSSVSCAKVESRLTKVRSGSPKIPVCSF